MFFFVSVVDDLATWVEGPMSFGDAVVVFTREVSSPLHVRANAITLDAFAIPDPSIPWDRDLSGRELAWAD